MFSSYQKFSVNGEDDENLAAVLQLAMQLSGNTDKPDSVESFYIDKHGYLILCTYLNSDNELEKQYPFKPTIPVLIEHIKSYIGELSDKDKERIAGSEPDTDGSTKLGWEVFAPSCHEIEPYDYNVIVAIRPCWIIYEK